MMDQERELALKLACEYVSFDADQTVVRARKYYDFLTEGEREQPDAEASRPVTESGFR